MIAYKWWLLVTWNHKIAHKKHWKGLMRCKTDQPTFILIFSNQHLNCSKYYHIIATTLWFQSKRQRKDFFWHFKNYWYRLSPLSKWIFYFISRPHCTSEIQTKIFLCSLSLIVLLVINVPASFRYFWRSFQAIIEFCLTFFCIILSVHSNTLFEAPLSEWFLVLLKLFHLCIIGPIILKEISLS